jgi:type IV secretion system protein TrbE
MDGGVFTQSHIGTTPGVILNKDGSFQRTFRYRGPDLDSATESELVSISARLNNVLKRFGDGWALFFEAVRVPANRYPGARFADAASWLVDEERRNDFLTESARKPVLPDPAILAAP